MLPILLDYFNIIFSRNNSEIIGRILGFWIIFVCMSASVGIIIHFTVIRMGIKYYDIWFW